MPNLTDVSIRAVRLPESGTVTVWDSSLKNFGLRVSPGGAKTFIVLLGSGRRHSIGRYPLISLSDARIEAKKLLAERTLGRIRPVHTAFDDARDRFLAHCEEKNRERTVRDYRRLLSRHYRFGRKGVADVHPREILRMLDKLSATPSERHHAFVAGRAFFRWCVRNHLLDRSPMESMIPPHVNSSRERVLDTDELQAVYKTARTTGGTFHRIVALCALTGQRKSEIGGLQWSWIGEDSITFPSSITKNRRTHTLPIGQAVKDILADIIRLKDNPYVFPATTTQVRGKPSTVWNGFGKAKAVFDTECGVSGWTLHDLRRTFSSGMAELGVPQVVVEKMLNHITGGTQSPIAQVYNRYSYMQEMRAAMEQWESYLQTLLNP